MIHWIVFCVSGIRKGHMIMWIGPLFPSPYTMIWTLYIIGMLTASVLNFELSLYAVYTRHLQQLFPNLLLDNSWQCVSRYPVLIAMLIVLFRMRPLGGLAWYFVSKATLKLRLNFGYTNSQTFITTQDEKNHTTFSYCSVGQHKIGNLIWA